MSQEAQENTGYNSESAEIILILVNVVPYFTDAEGWASILGDEVDIRRALISMCEWDVVSFFNVWSAVYIDAERVFLARRWTCRSIRVFKLYSSQIS